MILLSTTSASSFASGESIGIPPMPGPGYFGLHADPNFLNSFTSSALIGKTFDASGKLTDVHSCKSLADSACSSANFWQSSTLYPFCENSAQTDCIEEVIAQNEEGTKLNVTLGEKFPGVRRQDYVGNPERALPSGGQTNLVHIPGAPHASGDLYLAVVNPGGRLDERQFKGGTFNSSFQASLYAVKVNNGTFTAPWIGDQLSQYKQGAELWGTGSSVDSNAGCILNDTNVCAVPEEMPLDIKFGMKIRTSFNLTNWFSGRLNNSNISVNKGINQGSVITVVANPVVVPKITKWFKKSDLPTSLWDWYARVPKPWGGTGNFGLDAQNGPADSWSLLRDITGYSQFYMDEFLVWLPILGDKANYSPTLWSIRAMEGTGNLNVKCSSNSSIAGIVSTNATQYLDGPPSFNSLTQELIYKVASTHLLSDGSINKGTYDLVINSQTARCIYGFSSAPINAKIEITSADGQNQVAVTNVTERDGWIHLAARGFTFSDPTLKVKLTQEPAVSEVAAVASTPSPLANQSTSASRTTTSSIVCVKGKTIKKVTGLKPTCPAGYKKK